MRFMMFMLPNIPEEEWQHPTEEAAEPMSKYNESLEKAGVLLEGEGLRSQGEGVRVVFEHGKPAWSTDRSTRPRRSSAAIG